MPKHVVVDGSNIATEGRAMPSLKQLNEAVMAYIEEHPDDLITVVVDATFGHRIDPREVPEFDAAIENNELVSPPAGAIGRGDAFVLTIANKAGAIILSNDSFQEFHGDYPWLFDEGRLVGGKPVPHVGWVFVARAPVRGPISRRAVRDSARGGRAAVSSRTHGRPSKLASEPMPVPKSPPPGGGRGRGRRRGGSEPAEATPAATPAAPSGAAPPAASRQSAINDLLPFLGFVEQHPVGSTVEATAESYSSHGAYVTIDGVRGYVPLRFLGEPAPRSAREVLALGETATFVVVSFNGPRRGIDLAKPEFAPPLPATPPPLDLAETGVELAPEATVTADAVEAPAPAPAKKAAKRTRKAAKTVEAVAPEPVAVEPEPEPAPEPVKKAAKRVRKAAAKAVEPEPAAAVPEPEPVVEPVKKAAKRVRKAAAKAVEPEPAAVEPAPVKKAAKRVRKAAAKAVDEPAAAVEPAPAKKAAKRARKAPAAAAG